MNNTINNDELLSEQSGSQENQNLNSYTAISDQEKRQKMLLGKLSVPPTNFECDEWITLFKNFTQHSYNRFLYSSISATIISESDDTTASNCMKKAGGYTYMEPVWTQDQSVDNAFQTHKVLAIKWWNGSKKMGWSG